jgi:hypothetical protein
MVTIHVKDSEDYVMFTEGYRPEMDDIAEAWPQMPKFLHKSPRDFTSHDAALASTFGSCARRLAYHRRYELGGIDNVRNMPLDTVIIGPPACELAMLAAWYEAEPRPDEYRLVVHRSPRWHEGFALPPISSSVHKANRRRGKLKLIHRYNKAVPPPALRHCTNAFLQDLLHAYKGGTENVRAFIETSGHDNYSAFRL